jgi:hypothetical protein
MHVSTRLKVWGASLIAAAVIVFLSVCQRLADPPALGEDYIYTMIKDRFPLLTSLCVFVAVAGCFLLGLGCVSDQMHRRAPPSVEENDGPEE